MIYMSQNGVRKYIGNHGLPGGGRVPPAFEYKIDATIRGRMMQGCFTH